MDESQKELEMQKDVLVEKWGAFLDHKDYDPIKGTLRRKTTAVLLENQLKSMNPGQTEATMLSESTAPGTVASNVTNWDPILMSLVRRAAPKMIAYDVCGVQPMTGPSGLIFALRATYGRNGANATLAQGNEALGITEARSGFSGDPAVGAGTTGVGGSDFGTTAGSGIQGISVGRGMALSAAEILGSDTGGDFQEMSINIDSTSVTAKSRALKAEYSHEIQQDMKAIHGLDADKELANILTQEILSEQNREIVRTIYVTAKQGSQTGVTTPGQFDLDVDSNGRWSVERFRGLHFQLEREANVIAKETRRGKGNFVIASSDVASALNAAGVLDYNPALQGNLEVDDSGNTFAGTLASGMKVFIDPYHSATATNDFMCVGYRGTSSMDAGLFYCPYVPLQMYRAVGEDTFQPKIGFKTRYGLVTNPFVVNNLGTPDGETLTNGINQYYRFTPVINLT